MKQLSVLSFTLLVVLTAALYLPMIYGKVFFDDIEKTHLFYSPVAKDFIFKEKVVGKVPEGVRQKAEDHHAQISYTLNSKGYISRKDFEKLLPFIYYKNMEIWGMLPIELEGRSFDKRAIKSARRVLELKSAEINGQSPSIPVWPLMESNPDQARLVFPDDRFRMTDGAMEFINADTNRVDPDLTQVFTRALKEKGFRFPARSVNGKFTVLKPFDEGVFMVDKNHHVFHLKRVDGKPKLIKTKIDPAVQTRHIKISESRRKEFYGLVLGWDDKVYLLSHGDYKLIPLPLENYRPDVMDLKLIFNPLYCTAVYSDDRRIHAVAMDRDFNPMKTFSHTMSRATITPARRVYDALFPFVLHFDREGTGYLSVKLEWKGLYGLSGMVLCLLAYLAWQKVSGRGRPPALKVGLVALTGIYGLIAMGLTDMGD